MTTSTDDPPNRQADHPTGGVLPPSDAELARQRDRRFGHIATLLQISMAIMAVICGGVLLNAGEDGEETLIFLAFVAMVTHLTGIGLVALLRLIRRDCRPPTP